MPRRLLLVAALAALPLAARAGTPAGSAPAAPTPPIAIQPADFPHPAHPPLGVNLEGVVDWSRSMMFVDLMKSARKFGSPDTPWDAKAAVDDHGWPITDCGTVVVADAPVPPGDYLFSCTGKCDLGLINSRATVKNQTYNSDLKGTTATITVDNGADQLFLSFKNTSKGIQNIRLFRPGYALNSTDVFNQDFLKAIAPFSTLRTMDLTRTNQTDIVDWKDRPKITDARQASTRGVAWEYIIQLANQSGKDLWINIPDQASDDYVQQLAALCKANLNKDRVIYIEYSNEVWNSMFPSFHHNLDAAKAQVAAAGKDKSPLTDMGKDDNIYYWAWRRVPQRLLQIAAIFHAVYGDDSAAGKIRPVLASQSANAFMLRMQLEFIEKNFGPPSKFIYGVAGAPYIGPDAKISNRDDASVDELLTATSTTAFDWVKSVTLPYQSYARYYHVHSLCYEGGFGMDNPHSVNNKIAANRDPRIGKILQDYLDLWYSDGGELFMYYDLASSYSKFGCWGLTEDIRISTPKTQAVEKLVAAPTPPVAAGAAVPGPVPAWQYLNHDGGGIENSADGGKDLAFLREGSWFDYLLNVEAPPNGADVAVSLESASAQDGAQVELRFAGQSIGTIPCPNTGGWQTWQTSKPLLVHLPPGQITLRLVITKGGTNLKTIKLDKP